MSDTFHLSLIRDNCQLAISSIEEIKEFNKYREKRNEYLEKGIDQYEHLEGFDLYEHEPYYFLKNRIDKFLISTSRISKSLWPIRKDYKERGERLRNLLNIQFDHVIKDRSLRDALEHQDEKLDNWIKDDYGIKLMYSISDQPFKAGIVGSNNIVTNFGKIVLFHFDRVEFKFYFNNKVYDLIEMYNGVLDIYSKLNLIR